MGTVYHRQVFYALARLVKKYNNYLNGRDDIYQHKDIVTSYNEWVTMNNYYMCTSIADQVLYI